ncbi:MAG TPA: glycosyltransferase [Chthoniobacterales bacterium]|nr:glycosyltransferase [Chthoniobacterales bacterium]
MGRQTFMISVIIPTCERTEPLGQCLAQLEGAAEIIVSDDGQTFHTRQLLECRFPNVRWLPGPRRGPAANRNHGARYAKGDWLAFLDDDCIPDRCWLNEISRVISTADVIEGKTVCPVKTNHPLEEVIENVTGDLLWSCNLAIRRDLFEKLGRFDEDFLEAGGEDLALAWRIREMKLTVRFAPNAIVYHPARQLSVSKWIYRVFQSRWHLLYRLKVSNVSCATLHEILDLFRVTKRAVLLKERSRQLFIRLMLQWILLPIWVPYLIYCEIRFRRKLAKRL